MVFNVVLHILSMDIYT